MHKRVTFELCHGAIEQSMELALYKSHYYYNLLLLLLLSITLYRLVSKNKVGSFFLNDWQSNALSTKIYKTTQKL